MTDQLEETLINEQLSAQADFSVTSWAAATALRLIARSEADPQTFVRTLAESGVRAFRETEHPEVPPEYLPRYLDMLEARWCQLTASLLRPGE